MAPAYESLMINSFQQAIISLPSMRKEILFNVSKTAIMDNKARNDFYE